MICKYCSEDKPESDYLPRNKSRCRLCRNAQNRVWANAHREQISTYYRGWYGRNGRTRSPTLKASVQRWITANPDKVAAHNQVKKAISEGLLTRPATCDNCAKHCKPHAHHRDYSKPLTVLWLCASCHKLEHNRGLDFVSITKATIE